MVTAPMPVLPSRSFQRSTMEPTVSSKKPLSCANALLKRDRLWDEKQVGEWLQSINCGQYEKIFKGQFCRDCFTCTIKMLHLKSHGILDPFLPTGG